jgi:predicted ATPase
MSGKRVHGSVSPPRAPGRPFVGRARELHELRASLDQAQEGLGLLVLLSGEPGIGKTRLMQEAAREAGERGWRVAAGRCWEEGGAPAYWPWIQAVRSLGGEVERFAAAAGGSADPETVRFRLFDAAGQFLIEAAHERPLMVVLDDLHAADAPSLVLLRFVSEAIAGAPILVVGSYREREVRMHERRESFAELTRIATRISLQGLSEGDVEDYLAGVTGSEASRSLATRVHALTGGNPFFLGEVVRVVAHDGRGDEAADLDRMSRVPDEVRTLLRRRMADLRDETVDALRVAAVIGREFHLRVLERTSRLSVARLLDVLAEAGDAGVIFEDPAIPAPLRVRP